MLRKIIICLIIIGLQATWLSGCSFIFMPTETAGTSESSTNPATTETKATETESETTETTSASDTTETTETTAVPTTTETTVLPSDGFLTYTVKAGDTLFGISQMFDVPMARVAAANGITDFNLIYAGQVLRIPRDDDPLLDDYSTLSNNAFGWTYLVPEPLFQNIPAALPERAARLMEKYDGIWQLPDAERSVVYMTMDAGYEYGTNTSKILDIAKEKGFGITFFVTGSFIKNNPDVVLRMVNEGHMVGNHTERHLNQPKALDTSFQTLQEDILVAETRFTDLTGRTFAPYLRPPEGVYSERSLAVLRDMGYRAVFWSFAYNDWRTDAQPDPDAAYERIMGQLHNGSVLLLHTVSNTNVQILGRLVDGMRERGYSIELLPEQFP